MQEGQTRCSLLSDHCLWGGAAYRIKPRFLLLQNREPVLLEGKKTSGIGGRLCEVSRTCSELQGATPFCTHVVAAQALRRITASLGAQVG